MQQLLAFRNGMEMKGGGDGVTAGERILISENQELRQKCQHLQEVYHDCKMYLVSQPFLISLHDILSFRLCTMFCFADSSPAFRT